MLSGFIISKIVAVSAGPAGIALVGQFQNFVELITTFSKGGVDTALTKYTAEYRNNEIEISKIYSAGLIITATLSLTFSAIIIANSNFISQSVLNDTRYSYIISLFGFSLTLFALNGLAISIINGLQKVNYFVTLNIFQSIVTLSITIMMAKYGGFEGILVAIAVNQSVVLFLSLYAVWRLKFLDWQMVSRGITKDSSVKILKMGAMILTSATVSPITQILIRSDIIDNLGRHSAGIWQALMYISSVYISIFTASLAVYYLPKLSSLNNEHAIKLEIIHGLALIIPVATAGSIGIFIFRNQIVEILFTNEFRDMLPLFGWVLFGQTIKIIAWIFSYVMLAKSMTTYFVSTEIFFSFTYILFNHLFVSFYGIDGAAYAYVANYIIYFIAVVCVTKKYWFTGPIA